MWTALRILVAEAEPRGAELLRLGLDRANLNAEVHLVHDGQALLDWLSGRPPYDDPVTHPLPTLLLLDLNLPVIAGLEVLAWLRQQPRLKHLPVVVLTDPERGQNLAPARALGILGSVAKPENGHGLAELPRQLHELWRRATGGLNATSAQGHEDCSGRSP